MGKVNFLSLLCLMLATGLAQAQPPLRLVSVEELLKRPENSDPPQKASVEVLPPPQGTAEAISLSPAFQESGWEAAGSSGAMGRPGIFTTNVEYLLWFNQKETIPSSLVTTNPSFSPVPLTGATQSPSNPSPSDFQNRPLSGARVSLGYWFTTDVDSVKASNPLLRDTGVEFTGFVLGQRSIDFQADTSPTLLRPFYDLNNGKESSFLVAAPGVATGSVSASDKFDLWGTEANIWKTVYANPPGQTVRIDVMGGFRYLNFDSTLDMSSVTVYDKTQSNPAFVPFAGSKIDVMDRFQTSNQFFGGQVGLCFNYMTPCLIASANFKLGFGDTHQRITIAGNQLRTSAGGTITATEGGLYAQSSDIGTFDRDRFSLVPEIDFNFALPISRRFMFYAGYTLLGWNEVARSESQVDRVIDITQIPNFPAGAATSTGLARPAVPFKDEFLFVHGLYAGVRIIW